MSRLKENTEMIKEITTMLNNLITTGGPYTTQRLIRSAIDTTVLVDISKSLAIIADAVSEVEYDNAM